jgi:hypothetical protein
MDIQSDFVSVAPVAFLQGCCQALSLLGVHPTPQRFTFDARTNASDSDTSHVSQALAFSLEFSSAGATSVLACKYQAIVLSPELYNFPQFAQITQRQNSLFSKDPSYLKLRCKLLKLEQRFPKLLPVSRK